MLCRRSLVLMMLVCCAGSSAAASPRESMSAVSIRIHDYAQFDGRQLQRAERQVSDMYERIGVRLEWRAAVKPFEIEAGRGRWPVDGTASVTIVVLTGEMARRVTPRADAAGYAPITRERGGSIAYVFGERTREIAADGHVDTSKVLAGVIAHELAHLLMPGRSHSAVGLMRPHWNPDEFRQIYRQRFSSLEGASIRSRVRALGGNPSRVAD